MKRKRTSEQDLLKDTSVELQEILYSNPSFLIKYGTTIVCSLIILLIICSFFIYYPDKVTGEAHIDLYENINTKNIISNSSEKIYNGNYVAIMKFPLQDTIKIKIGQIVNFKFNNSQKTENEQISGKISSVCINPNEKKLLVMAVLQLEAKSTSAKRLIIHKKTEVSAEIMIENKSVFERIFDPLLKIFINSQ